MIRIIHILLQFIETSLGLRVCYYFFALRHELETLESTADLTALLLITFLVEETSEYEVSTAFPGTWTFSKGLTVGHSRSHDIRLVHRASIDDNSKDSYMSLSPPLIQADSSHN